MLFYHITCWLRQWRVWRLSAWEDLIYKNKDKLLYEELMCMPVWGYESKTILWWLIMWLSHIFCVKICFILHILKRSWKYRRRLALLSCFIYWSHRLKVNIKYCRQSLLKGNHKLDHCTWSVIVTDAPKEHLLLIWSCSRIMCVDIPEKLWFSAWRCWQVCQLLSTLS